MDQIVNDEPLVYLDNVQQRLKSQAQAFREQLRIINEKDNANVHRGVHICLAGQRQLMKLRSALFIHAASTKEVLFTRGATTGAQLGGALCRK